VVTPFERKLFEYPDFNWDAKYLAVKKNVFIIANCQVVHLAPPPDHKIINVHEVQQGQVHFPKEIQQN
jgi:hypothetical protein